MEPTAKRRKVRKGTQSCWECKKRKVRCIFALPTNTVCNNCVRRKTTCISQEYVADPDSPPQKLSHGIEARLSRVEDLLERLIAQGGQPLQSDSIAKERQYRTTESRNSLSLSSHNGDTPVLFLEGLPTPARTLQMTETPLTNHYTGLAHDLVAAWPTQQDLAQIYALPVGLATHLHMTICAESPETRQAPLSSRNMLQLPPPGSHPVLIVRKLLYLASLLQGALSTSDMLAPSRQHFREILSRVFDTATRLVTTNDELTASVEGLDCILIEAMIFNYSGYLHRAWMAIRRATAVAQMMGLHRNSRSISPKFLDPTTKTSFAPNEVIFVVFNMDCYLSVMLGLPRSSFETKALIPEAIAECQPIERLGRMLCVIADRILERKDGTSIIKQAADIPEIDQLLQDAAATMPPQWWLIPDFRHSAKDAASSYQEIGRVNYQLAYHHLVLRLHLPFMLHSCQHSEYDHSKLTVVTTCRDILSLYIAFRTWNDGRFYCRGMDYIASMAFTMLCVAHVSARSLDNPVQGN
ncbi:hypothetical protein CC86DRAFT_324442, partial [Ophiobolus disseminans]